MTAPSNETIKGECPECDATRNADVMATHHEPWSDDEAGISGGDTLNVLKCRGCETIYVQKESWFSEDISYRYNYRTNQDEPYIPTKVEYWPNSHKRKRPTWRVKIFLIDTRLAGLFEEIYSAYDAELNVLAAIGVRTTFDRASELLGVDPAKGFGEKLAELATNGKIGSSEQGILATVTDAGSAAAHRGWRPSKDELDVMLDVIESFISRNFVLEGAVQKLKNAVPPKPPRQPKVAKVKQSNKPPKAPKK
ncbi:MAG TPA: DUF4145 domain-containing protein [Phenylobacterium sp.]|nr:DUF4145 domain-containing protein [Phenylobacterium sp.]